VYIYSSLHRPGDNQFQCAAGDSCGNPTITLDPFVTFGNIYVDVSAGGPSPFTFTATSNVSWLHISPNSGSLSTSNSESRLFLSVDWSKVSGVEAATINFIANATGQPVSIVPAQFIANHTVVPSGFKGQFNHLNYKTY
jgi:hypothetical protein